MPSDSGRITPSRDIPSETEITGSKRKASSMKTGFRKEAYRFATSSDHEDSGPEYEPEPMRRRKDEQTTTEADRLGAAVTAPKTGVLTKQEIGLKLWNLSKSGASVDLNKDGKIIQHQQVLLNIVRGFDKELFNRLVGNRTKTNKETGKEYRAVSDIGQARYNHKRHAKKSFDQSKHDNFGHLQANINLISFYQGKLSPTEKDNFEVAKALVSVHNLIYELGTGIESLAKFHDTFKDKLNDLGL